VRCFASEDSFWIGCPNEGFGVGVGIGDEAVDGELPVNDGLERAGKENTAAGRDGAFLP
jgi:hypothetical protein